MKRNFAVTLLFAALWAAVAFTIPFPMYGQPAAGPATTRPVAPMAWYQPADPASTAKWKARNVFTFYGLETEGVAGDAAVKKYMDAMRVAGMYVILPVRAQAFWNDPICKGIIADPDEPDAKGIATAAFRATCDAYRAACPGKPIYITLNAGALLGKPDADVAAYCAGADVIGFFSYPYNFGLGAAGVLGEVGPSLDKLHRLAPGKPVFFCGECGDQDMKNNNFWKTQPRAALMHAPNGDEMAFEYGVALAHGANGLMEFSHKLGPGWEGFDSTTPECDRVMTYLNALYLPPGVTTVSAAPATQPTITIDIKVNGATYVPR